jgi:FKBP-type peptidyl-prolyl cis-trans isomerase FkpA
MPCKTSSSTREPPAHILYNSPFLPTTCTEKYMRNVLKLIASLILVASVAACGGGSGSSSTSSTPVDTSGSSAITTLQIDDTTVGTGAVANAGNTVTVSYTGWLYNVSAANYEGTEFDSSAADGQPLSFTIGAGQVIPGMEQGVVGMKVGGIRNIIIPSSLAYGACGTAPNCQGTGVIPPNAALVFTVQLLSVQ